MTPEQKTELHQAIFDELENQSHSGSIKSYVSHYFWRYYENRKRRGLPWSIEEFWAKIPTHSRNTRENLFEMYVQEHSELFAQLELPGTEPKAPPAPVWKDTEPKAPKKPRKKKSTSKNA